MTLTLVLGGARSGKSAYAQKAAETLAAARNRPPLLIATAEGLDQEMADRIARHQAERGDHWRCVEAPLALETAISALNPGDVAVVDCLTLWLTNLMMAKKDLIAARRGLTDALGRTRADVFLVSNEVGLGLVPETPLGRAFRDEAGRLNQTLAAQADRALFIAAGLPLVLKGA